MPGQTYEAVSLLRERHIRDFCIFDLQILAGVELGCDAPDIADYLGVRPGRIQQGIAHLEARIFDPLPLEASRPGLQAFTRDHFSCCTEACIELVESTPEGRERLALLRNLHVVGLTRRELQAAGALERGYSYLRIADGLGILPSSANALVGRVQRKVFDRSPINPTHGDLSKWTYEQYDCCTRGAAILVETGQLFDQ
jgi:DNA-binding CsgD family transcriptional regulator